MRPIASFVLPFAATLALAAYQNGGPAITAPDRSATPPAGNVAPFRRTEFARFDQPWAMTFLPDGRLLVSEKAGRLKLFDPATKRMGEIGGSPAVAYGGQGGLGDVAPPPRFADNEWVYFSHAEADEGSTRSVVVARAKLTLDVDGGGRLRAPETIWRQVPKVKGGGHYSHRIVFAPNGGLFIGSGDRQTFEPAQDMRSNLGRIVRLDDDGSFAAGNPFVSQGGIAAQVWTLGHRNVLGLAFDARGQLWSHEMGPKGGDEFNRVVRGDNYGWPVVSDGDHYDGRPIPRHASAPQYHAPEVGWTPVISPSSLIFCDGAMFPRWRGRALIGGLSSQSPLVVKFDGDSAAEETRYPMGSRIREVEQGPDGALWLLEGGGNARLLRLTPAS
ncbi:PQQ-dependent sugar dehydrogenase [Lysobacter pythonis]|uniref:PQQ-dependent sugar dehydrogenase n=1 Tax=Solilutibacter pythonis TaxID=2483112 RepID=A0A3M2I0H4_9GAMM|nr:PQQ-dependent sugar dehydrogenase [Lysobacter pythonis]RMH93400.1 PQQ-dependent sugar dehydrogenase [Lysobacter pythonis]